MKSSISGTCIVGIALLIAGCATKEPVTPPSAQAVKQGEVCTAVGSGVWPTFENDGSFSDCHLPDNWQIEVRNADKLACVQAGGIPKVNGQYDYFDACPGNSSVQCHYWRSNVSCEGKVVTQQVQQTKTYCNTTTIGNQQHTNCKSR